MGLREREFLFMAANSALGIELESTDIDKDLRALNHERRLHKELKYLQIRRAPTANKIWLVRTSEATTTEEELDLEQLDLEDLGLGAKNER